MTAPDLPEGAQLADPYQFAGAPDSLQRLWTPYRMSYLNADSRPKDDRERDCPFCLAPQRTDEDALIVHRAKRAFVLLNLYPYNPGHALVCTYRHVAAYTELTSEETIEIAELTQQTIKVIAEVSKPAGFNLGVNQGAVAGGSVAAHFHQHVVPRWQGDASFLPIIARSKQLPQLLGDTRQLFAQAWPKEDGC